MPVVLEDHVGHQAGRKRQRGDQKQNRARRNQHAAARQHQLDDQRDERRRRQCGDDVGEQFAQMPRHQALQRREDSSCFVKKYSRYGDVELRPKPEHHPDANADQQRDRKSRTIHGQRSSA